MATVVTFKDHLCCYLEANGRNRSSSICVSLSIGTPYSITNKWSNWIYPYITL